MFVITCSEGTRDPPNKDGLAGIQGLRSVHHEVAVAQVPRSNLHLERKYKVLTLLALYSANIQSLVPAGCAALTGLSLMVGLETHR